MHSSRHVQSNGRSGSIGSLRGPYYPMYTCCIIFFIWVSSLPAMTRAEVIASSNPINDLKILLKLKKERYCGNHLPNIVHLVCEGVYYDGISKRSLPDSNDAELNTYIDDSSNSEDVIYAKGALHPELQNGGGIYQECCVKSCTLLQLRAYCKKKISAAKQM